MLIKRFLFLSLFFAYSTNCAAGFEGMFPEYEKKPLDLIALFLPENPTIFEAGGHYGEDTARFAKKWPKSTIISFEANPFAFKKLVESTKNITNIFPYHLAVNNYNGTATLNICNDRWGDGSSSLLPASSWMEKNYAGNKVDVPCVILQDFCKDNKVDVIDFIWLDLEGLELQVIKASPELLKTVKVIYTETNFLKFREGMTQYKELRSFLENSGFKMLAHWYQDNYQGNALFIKGEILDAGAAKVQKNSCL